MKKFFALLLTLIMVLSMVACGGGKQEEPAKTDEPPAKTEQPAPSEDAKIKETLRIGFDEDLPSGNPYNDTITATATFTNLTFNTLIYIDPDDGSINPELATEWTDVNGDGLVWDLKLVEGATFHNGNAFTADDVKFTVEYATDPNNCMKTIAGPGIDAIDSIEVVSDYVVRFNLNTSTPDFVSYLEQKMYDKESFDTLAKEEASIIGTGPYYFNRDMTQTGVQFTATRYDNYWGGAENHPTKNLTFVYYPSSDTQVAALQAGEIDVMAWVPVASLIPTLQADSNIIVDQTNGAFSYYLAGNYRKDFFDDPEVRKAFMMAIDKDALVAVAYDGGAGGSASYNFCAPVGLGHDPDVKVVGYDPEAAKEILEAKGLVGKKFNIFYPGLAVNKAMCEVVQSCFAAVGVELEIMSRDVTNWMALKASEEYDFYIDCCAYQGALLYNYGRFFGEAGSANLYVYESDEYMAAQAKVTEKGNFDEMVAEFSNLPKFVAEDLPILPLCYNTATAACRTNVYGAADALAPTLNFCDYSQVYATE